MHDGIAVLPVVLCGGEQANRGEVLDIERHGEQSIAQHPVEVRERLEVAEVKSDVLAIPRSPSVFDEVPSIGIDAEKLALLPQMLRCVFLGAEVEGYALGLRVGYLLSDGQQGLGVLCSVGVGGMGRWGQLG